MSTLVICDQLMGYLQCTDILPRGRLALFGKSVHIKEAGINDVSHMGQTTDMI